MEKLDRKRHLSLHWVPRLTGQRSMSCTICPSNVYRDDSCQPHGVQTGTPSLSLLLARLTISDFDQFVQIFPLLHHGTFILPKAFHQCSSILRIQTSSSLGPWRHGHGPLPLDAAHPAPERQPPWRCFQIQTTCSWGISSGFAQTIQDILSTSTVDLAVSGICDWLESDPKLSGIFMEVFVMLSYSGSEVVFDDETSTSLHHEENFLLLKACVGVAGS